MEIGQLTAHIERLLSQKPLKTACQEVARLLREKRRYFWVGVYLRRGEVMERLAFAGPLPPCDVYPLVVGGVGWVGLHGRPRIIQNTGRALGSTFPEARSEMVVPILKGGATVGAIEVKSDQPGYFGEGDIRLLTMVAEQISRVL
jgi:putative methionine-R-sulfoxide reductase with GAF domain